MKKLARKMVALVAAMVMVLAMGVTAFAQDVGTANANDGATITITNAAKGETYKIYKLFDATVTGTEGGSIAYTGTIPTSLGDYFTADTAGNISAKVTSIDSTMAAALKSWAESQTPTAQAVSDGSELVFQGLEYGYYVVTTTQGDTAITVDSTNPNAEIVDKNSTTPVNNLKKDADNTDVNIGDTLTYTISFGTANYYGEGEDAEQITSYKISDTLPDFLTNVNVTGIKVVTTEESGTEGEEGYQPEVATTLTVQQFTNKTITIPWVDDDGASLYPNGAKLVITYTATLADTAAIDGEGNTNTVTVTPVTDSGDKTPTKNTDTETVYTYAIALKKVNDKGNALAGAEFTLPFYVKTETDANGAYIYAGTTAGTGLTNVVTTPTSGEITIKGVKSGTYQIEETKAPDGYNKLTSKVPVTATKTGETTTNTTTYLDADGNITDQETTTTVTYKNDNLAATAAVVVNKTGAELPSTGGMGTTIFYVLGAILVIGAGVVLVTRRRVTR